MTERSSHRGYTLGFSQTCTFLVILCLMLIILLRTTLWTLFTTLIFPDPGRPEWEISVKNTPFETLRRAEIININDTFRRPCALVGRELTERCKTVLSIKGSRIKQESP